MFDMFHFFLYFLRLKPNLTQCEITGIGALKGVQVADCDMCFNNINNNKLQK